MDLHELAKNILKRGMEGSKDAARDGEDFLPMFFLYGDDWVRPMPMPHYTRDREFHQALMRTMIASLKADGYLFIMEAWFSEYKSEQSINAPGFIPPSERPDREEMLVIHGMSRAGDQAGYCCKIKRHGHKLVFGDVEDMMDTAHGKSMVALMGPMFGEKVN